MTVFQIHILVYIFCCFVNQLWLDFKYKKNPDDIWAQYKAVAYIIGYIPILNIILMIQSMRGFISYLFKKK